MDSYEVVGRAFKKTPPKKVAAGMGLSESMVRKWGQPKRASGIPNPADRFVSFVKCLEDLELVHWVCAQFGGFFVLNPKASVPSPASLAEAENALIGAYSDQMKVIAEAARDNRISPDEARKIRECGEQVKSVQENFVRSSEQGLFGPE